MIRLDFDFDFKLKQFKTSQIALKEQLENDILTLQTIVGKQRPPGPVPPDLIEWAENLFEECIKKNDFKSVEDACPQILKYLTVSSQLSKYLSTATNRLILFNLLNIYKRDRPLGNLLLYFFKTFQTIDEELKHLIGSLIDDYLEEKPPKLPLLNFYFFNELNLDSSTHSIVNETVSKFSIEEIVSGYKFPSELRETDFYHELLIALSGRMHSATILEKNIYWMGIKAVNKRDLHIICLSRFVLNSTSPTDIEFCKARAMEYVGDPSQRQLWRVSNTFRSHEDTIEQARKKIEVWINQQFIAAFFQTMKASNRGSFWVNHIKSMISVRVLAPLTFMQVMKTSFPSAASYLDNKSHFIPCGGHVAGILIEFKKHKILVFSVEGMASICRLSSDKQVAQFKYYGNLRNLVDGSLQLAFTRSGSKITMRDYGRMLYFPDWEPFFDYYLKNKIL